MPGTVIPGLCSGLGLILVGKGAGGTTLGYVSLAWVTANFGSTILGLSPAHTALRAVVVDGPGALPQYRAATVRRALIGGGLVTAFGIVLALLGGSAGVALALGGVWIPAQVLVLFETEVLRGRDGFGEASFLLSLRSVLGWSASVAMAFIVGTQLGVLAPQILLSTALAAFLVIRGGLHRTSAEAKRELREVGRPVQRLAEASYALGYADRYVVQIINGPLAVGIYTLGYIVGQGLLETVMTPLANACTPRILSEWQHSPGSGAAQRTIRHGTLVLAALSIASIPAVVIADRLGLLSLISSSPDLAPVIILVALSTGVQGVTRLTYALLLAQRRAQAAAKAYWMTLAVSLVLVPALTWGWGIIGASVATLAAYLLLAGSMWRTSMSRSASTAGAATVAATSSGAAG